MVKRSCWRLFGTGMGLLMWVSALLPEDHGRHRMIVMVRLVGCGLVGLLLLVGASGFLSAEEAKTPKHKIPLGPPAPTLEEVRKDPGDAKKLSRFAIPLVREVHELAEDQPELAEMKRKALIQTLEGLQPEGDAVRVRDSLLGTAKALKESIAFAQLSAEEVERALVENPDDEKALSNWLNKVIGEIGSLTYGEPEAAAAKVAAAREFLTKISASAKEEKTKQRIETFFSERNPRGMFPAIEDRIEKGREYAQLIGREAVPLRINTWVNGQPLTPEDLKGKVVLLDFFAIWCGPCIATFPHLREWHEKYADRGLVIVGLTRYYGYRWDDEEGYVVPPQIKRPEPERNEGKPAKITDGKGAAGRPQVVEREEAPPEVERQMLEKFAAYYHLKHPFGIQEEGDDTLTDFYAVRGIPHVVVIDQQNKIRLVRIGSGKRNAAAIDAVLAELLK